MKNLFDMAAALRSLKDIISERDAELKRLKAQAGEIEESMAELMLEDDIQNFAHAGYTYYLNARMYANVPGDKLEAFIRRVRRRKFGGIVKTTILPQTLAAFTKEQVEASGGQMPAWMAPFVVTHIKNTVGIRKK